MQSGWIAAYDGERLYPQQSVAKLWTALAVFDAADRGALRLTDPVTVRPDDMSVFNQPIQKMIVDGRFDTTIDGLLVLALARSDNAANDILLRRLDGGGPLCALIRRLSGGGAVRTLIRRRRLGAIRAGETERELEAKIAGVRWKREYSFGRAFWDARDQVPLPVRQAKLDAYVADPDDGASPVAVVDGLARLKRGAIAVRGLHRAVLGHHGVRRHRSHAAEGRARPRLEHRSQDRHRPGPGRGVPRATTTWGC